MSESVAISFERRTDRAASRSEALRQAVDHFAPESAASAFAALKSLYAEIMPCASRRNPRPTTAVSESIAVLAGVDLTTLAAANAVPLRQALDPAVTELVVRVGEVLMPTVLAVLAASAVVRPDAIAAQERLAGRSYDSAARDNFRTRTTSRLTDEAADALRGDPRLLDDASALTRVVVAAAHAGLADPTNERWSTNWCEARRHVNGHVRPIVVTEPEHLAAWQAHAAVVRPRMVAFAQRLVRHDDAAAEDLVQEALLKTLQQGGAGDRESFVRHAMAQVRQVHADACAQKRRELLVDWNHREGDARTPEERTFGAAERAWSGEVEMHDGRLDAAVVIERLSRPSGTAHGDAVRTELARVAARVRAGDPMVDRLTERRALITHLVSAVRATCGLSGAAARAIVLETFAEIEREERP